MEIETWALIVLLVAILLVGFFIGNWYAISNVVGEVKDFLGRISKLFKR